MTEDATARPDLPPGELTKDPRFQRGQRQARTAVWLSVAAVPSTLLLSALLDGIADDGVLGAGTLPVIAMLSLAWYGFLALIVSMMSKARRAAAGSPAMAASVYGVCVLSAVLVSLSWAFVDA